MASDEVVLSGGNVNAVVVRVGDTVRRALTPSSPTIHRLLLHLEAKGFAAAPRFLGTDDKNREILSFVPGTANDVSRLWTEEAPLLAVARLLREYHLATMDFIVSDADIWAKADADRSGYEVNCHNDFAPYNLISDNGIVFAAIDFDLAGPGSRLRDIAYAAYWAAPLSFAAPDLLGHAEADVARGSGRLKAFCREYGVAADATLLDAVATVLDEMGDLAFVTSMVGLEAATRLADGGHLAHWHRERYGFLAARERLSANL